MGNIPSDQPGSSDAPEEQPATKWKPDEGTEIIPPFSLLFEQPEHSVYPARAVAEIVRRILQQNPEGLQNETLTKRAITAVAGYGAPETGTNEFFSYQFAETRQTGFRPVTAVTFKNPKALIDSPVEVQEAVRNLGPRGIEALAEFALLFTGTAKPEQPRSAASAT